MAKAKNDKKGLPEMSFGQMIHKLTNLPKKKKPPTTPPYKVKRPPD